MSRMGGKEGSLVFSLFIFFGGSALLPAPFLFLFIKRPVCHIAAQSSPLPGVASFLWTPLSIPMPEETFLPVLWFFPSVSSDSAN